MTIGGSGVTPSMMVVGGATQLTATFTIAADAVTGPRAVTVTTGGEVATLAVGFVVTSSPGLSFSVHHSQYRATGRSGL